MEIKTEVDSNAINECTHDDRPSTGMLGFPFSMHAFAFVIYAWCITLFQYFTLIFIICICDVQHYQRNV